jgi:hypothetical protein
MAAKERNGHRVKQLFEFSAFSCGQFVGDRSNETALSRSSILHRQRFEPPHAGCYERRLVPRRLLELPETAANDLLTGMEPAPIERLPAPRQYPLVPTNVGSLIC